MGLALLLIVAGTLKLHQVVADSQVFLSSRADSCLATIAISVTELVVGGIVFGGSPSKRARSMLRALFSLFFCVAVYEAVTGAQTCACFGRLSFHPWWAVGIDVAVLVLLALPMAHARAQGTHTASGSRHRMVASGTATLACSVIAIASGLNGFQGEGIMYDRHGHVALLLPDRWNGKPLPLLKHLEGGELLARGRWLIILYRHNCPACNKLIENYMDVAKGAGGRRLAWVEIPPFGLIKHFPLGNQLRCRLPETNEWIVETPVVLSVDDSIVTKINIGTPEERSS